MCNEPFELVEPPLPNIPQKKVPETICFVTGTYIQLSREMNIVTCKENKSDNNNNKKDKFIQKKKRKNNIRK